MSSENRREWANNMRRLSEADDNAAVSFGRDLIKFGQWLNAGAIAAMPVVANAVGLSAAAMISTFKVPALLFIGGLVCSALSTIFAFNALAKRGDSRLVASDAGFIQASVPNSSEQISRETALTLLGKAESMYRESSLLHDAFATHRYIALL